MFSTRLLSLGLALLPFAAAKVIDIKVGEAGALLYSPEAVGASVGDQGRMTFNPIVLSFLTLAP